MVGHNACDVFSLGHSEASRLLKTECIQISLEFHNSNWPIVCHFFSSSDNNNGDYAPQVQLILCNHNVSFNGLVVSEIISNYSKSSVSHLVGSRYMLNANSDIKTFLAFTDCTDEHSMEDLTHLVPLVQTAEDEPSYITT